MKAKKILFMLKKLIRDFNTNKDITIAENIKSQSLNHYYIKFDTDTSKLNRLITSFDKNGIPLNTTYIDVKEKKLHYYPISIGQYALAIFNSYIDKNRIEDKEQFLKIADWFMDNKIDSDYLGTYWLTHVDKPEYNVFTPWKSAFTQSRALSVLMRAWQITGDNKYFETCIKSLKIFTIPVEAGGVSSYFTLDKRIELPIFEEYTAEKATRVLDGHIFSLFGIHEFIRANGNSHKESYQLASNIFQQGINALIHILPKYDMGYWVKFNLCEIESYPKNDPCTIGYLRLIVKQLEILYLITNEKTFLNYSKKFKRYDNTKNVIRMYFEKFNALRKLNRL